MSADMEGVAGIVDRAQVDPVGAEYALGRRLMTGEVNAVVAGAFDAGATDLLVCDAHWNKRNLEMESLDPRARIVAGGPRELGMMEGIDATFNAAIFVGYHAREVHPRGVLAHTWSHERIDELRLNGEPAGEGALNALVAGHFGVPVVLSAGDRWANDEIRAFLGDVETADVKEGRGLTAAETLVPARARELIRERTRVALANRGRYRPARMPGTIVVEVRFKEVPFADRAMAGRAGAERMDAKTTRCSATDALDAFRAFAAMA